MLICSSPVRRAILDTLIRTVSVKFISVLHGAQIQIRLKLFKTNLDFPSIKYP